MASDYYRVTDTETRLRSVTHSLGLVLAGFLLSGVSVAIVATLLSVAGLVVGSFAALPPLPYAALSASQFLGFFAVVFAYLHWQGYPDLFDADLPSLWDLAWIGGGFVALFALHAGFGLLIQVLGLDLAVNSVIEQGQRDPVRFLYLIPVTLLFVAPSEELLFRGVIQGLFRRAYGVVPALLLASALFGAVHWLALIGASGGRLVYVAIAAALGLVLGILYELRGNILVPIAVHGLWNTFLFGGQYLLATGAVSG